MVARSLDRTSLSLDKAHAPATGLSGTQRSVAAILADPRMSDSEKVVAALTSEISGTRAQREDRALNLSVQEASICIRRELDRVSTEEVTLGAHRTLYFEYWNKNQKGPENLEQPLRVYLQSARQARQILLNEKIGSKNGLEHTLSQLPAARLACLASRMLASEKNRTADPENFKMRRRKLFERIQQNPERVLKRLTPRINTRLETDNEKILKLSRMAVRMNVLPTRVHTALREATTRAAAALDNLKNNYADHLAAKVAPELESQARVLMVMRAAEAQRFPTLGATSPKETSPKEKSKAAAQETVQYTNAAGPEARSQLLKFMYWKEMARALASLSNARRENLEKRAKAQTQEERKSEEKLRVTLRDMVRLSLAPKYAPVVSQILEQIEQRNFKHAFDRLPTPLELNDRLTMPQVA